jgi:uncharacterized repeat protein (TIGR01451 family)
VSRPLFSSLIAAAALAVLGSASVALGAGGGSTGADLQLSGSASTGSPTAGQPFSYAFQIKNAGPQGAFGTVFRAQLPAGTVVTATGGSAAGVGAQCTTSAGVSGPIVSCVLGWIGSSAQGAVQIDVDAPAAAGSYTTTATVSSDVSDPQPSNNSTTIGSKVQQLPTCPLPAGQTTLHGIVVEKYTNSSGLFENFLFQVDGINYYVDTNFYDGAQPLTSIVNLLCKPVSTVFVQSGGFMDVTGTDSGSTIILPGTTTPVEVFDASVIQVPFYFDKAL